MTSDRRDPSDVVSTADVEHERIRRAQRSLIDFARRMSPRYRPAPHHRLIAEHLEAVERGEIDRLIITMPPRHGKTELASRRFPAWFLGRNPERRVIVTSYAAGLASRLSRAARNNFSDARWPFADVRLSTDLVAVQSWDTSAGGGLIAAGVGGGITGSGGDVLIIDDPIKNAEEADSQTRRDSIWEWYQETAYTRLEGLGAVVVIGTRWHDDDLIGRLLAAGEEGGDQWTVLHLPAIAEEDDPLGREPGEALWPERFPIAKLLRIKANISSRMWDAQYRGAPRPVTGGTFPRRWWRRYDELPTMTRVEIFVDSAFKEGVGNDFTAITVWGTAASRDPYLIHGWRDKVEFPRLIRMIHHAYGWAVGRFPDKWPLVVVEDKASGQSALQVLKLPYLSEGQQLPALPVVAHPVPPGSTKVSRAEAVTGIVEGGRAYIPKDAEAPWLEEWLSEHERFPQGKHDDYVDTTSMAIARLCLGGYQGGGLA